MVELLRRVSVVLAALLWALPVSAQSDDQAKHSHILPHVADGDGWRSSVLVTNVAESAAFCTLRLHGLGVDRFEAIDGVTASGSMATFELAGRGGSLVWDSRNAAAQASGYATVDCNAAVVAQVVFAWLGDGERPSGSATVFSAQKGREFQFPVLTAAGTLGFAIANDNDFEAECDIVLEDPLRTNLGEASVAAPSKTNRARMLHMAIPIPEGFVGGSATVSCNRQVAMMGLHFELEPDGAIVTFNTLPPALLDTFLFGFNEQAKRQHILPHIADGGGWRSSLIVTNVEGSDSRCALELRGLTADRFQAAEGIEASRSTAAFELGRTGGYLVWGTRAEGAPASGYATLDCSAPVVAQVVFAWAGEGERPTGMATVFSSQADRFFQLPVLTPAATVGFAIANDTPDDATCRIVLDDQARVRVGNVAIAVPAKTNVSQLLNAVVEIPEDFVGGKARVGCDRTVAAIGLHFELAPDGEIATFNTLPPAVVDSISGGDLPPPTVMLTVSRDAIEAGGAATLDWSSTDAVSATITPDIGSVSTSGTREVSPGVTTTYRITVVGADGRTATTTVTVAVEASARDVLRVLYEATDGENWRMNQNWLTDRPLSTWHGVRVDDEGRVTGLKLDNNNLRGPVPRELAGLIHLTELDLFNNYLSGSIPPELGNLTRLTLLDLSGGPGGFLGIPGQMTGPIPPELGALTRLKKLSLRFNKLTGPIPPELGALTDVELLFLQHNGLTGPIPPELGALTNLRTVELGNNDLTGPIPAELGRLSVLKSLYLPFNRLTGRIPPELGGLSRVVDLDLRGNRLTGPIPPELGPLPLLHYLYLTGNDLTGPIPQELGSAPNLRWIYLDDNDLTGNVPPELGGLENLEILKVSGNARMSGALPVELAGAIRIQELLTTDTGLCAPSDAGFRNWLSGIQKQRLPACGDPPPVYLTQAAQSRRFPVSLIAGEEALLRVFVTAPDAGGATLPPVWVRFYLDGLEVHSMDIPAGSAPIPAEVDEGSLEGSVNARVPADVVQPGLELVAIVDPDQTLDPELELTRRIPESGRLPVHVRTAPGFDLTMIPFVRRSAPDRSIVELVEAMAADPEGHELLEDARALLPIGELEVKAHEPVTVDTANAHTLLRETTMIHAMEGADTHYMGTIAGAVTGGAAGVAYQRFKTSFVTPNPFVIAHELGHNFSLQHAPCRADVSLDRMFPNDDGSTGVWGYDFRDGGRLVSPATPDLMSFCRRPHWISDYHFSNALGFRIYDATIGWRGILFTFAAEESRAVDAGASESVDAGASESVDAGASRSVAPGRSLLLWGGVDAGGAPFLEPAFVVDAPASLPTSTGDYRLVGRTADGADLFSLVFEMPKVDDGDGQSSFAFAVPVDPGWADDLAGVTLMGPGGFATLDGNTDRPVTILRNSATGQVRGILRDRPSRAAPGTAAFALPLEPGMEATTSRGLPDPADWSR